MENFIKSITLYPKNKTKQTPRKPNKNHPNKNRMFIGAVTEMLPNRMSKVITAYLLVILHFLIVYSVFPEH